MRSLIFTLESIFVYREMEKNLEQNKETLEIIKKNFEFVKKYYENLYQPNFEAIYKLLLAIYTKLTDPQNKEIENYFKESIQSAKTNLLYLPGGIIALEAAHYFNS